MHQCKNMLIIGPAGSGLLLATRNIVNQVAGAYQLISAAGLAQCYLGEAARRIGDSFKRCREGFATTGQLQFIIIDEIDATPDDDDAVPQALLTEMSSDLNKDVVVIATAHKRERVCPNLRCPECFEHINLHKPILH